MALRNQPYIPLYVKDFTSDEKLRMCSPAAVGVYIYLMCTLHREEEYGKLKLQRKFVYTKRDTNAIQTEVQKANDAETLYADFADNLAKQMPFKAESIKLALLELDYYGVIRLEGETLVQPRMVKDGKLSETRSKSVQKRWGENRESDGVDEFVGTNTDTKGNTKKVTKTNTNTIENTEYENVYENNTTKSIEGGAGGRAKPKAKKAFTPPTYEEVAEYCRERGNNVDAQLFVDHYAANGWVQGKAGKPLQDWKAAVRTWERNGIRTGGNNGTATAETRQQAEAAANNRRVDAGEGQPKHRRSTL